MKFFSLFIIFSFLFAVTAQAQTISPTATTSTITPTQGPTQADKEQSLNEQIDQIKSKIAAGVAKLHLVDKRGFIGTVTETTSTAISLNDMQGNIRFVDVDQLTNFASPSAKSKNFGISDLTKGTIMSAIGRYNKDTKRLQASYISVITIPEFMSGVVTDLDRVNFTVTIATEKKINELVDVDSVTKAYSYDTDANETKSGFSKVVLGERVFVVGYADAKEKNRMSATRILLFPVLPPNPNISVSIKITPTSTADLSPTLGPVKKTTTPTP